VLDKNIGDNHMNTKDSVLLIALIAKQRWSFQYFLLSITNISDYFYVFFHSPKHTFIGITRSTCI